MNFLIRTSFVVLTLSAQESYARFYTGIDIGLNNTQSHVTLTRNANSATDPAGDYLKIRNGSNSFVPGIFGGWNYRSGIFAAGVEIGGNLDTLDEKVYRETSQDGEIVENLKISRKGALDAAIRFSYYPHPNGFFFIKTGITYAKFKTKYSGVDPLSDPGQTYHDSIRSSKDMAAFKLSVGYEAFVLPCLSVRGELSHAFSASHKLSIPAYDPQTYLLEDSNAKYRIAQTAFKIGIAYHF